MKDMLELGQIVNTHALKGEVKVVVWADYPEVMGDVKEVFLKGGSLLRVKNVRYQKGTALVKFDGIDTVEEAEKLKNSVLYVPKSAFGSLPEDTFFVADLIGLEVKDENTVYGKIKDVITTGSNDVYVIDRKGEKDLLLPALKSTVKEVNIDGGYMIVEMLEGLLDI